MENKNDETNSEIENESGERTSFNTKIPASRSVPHSTHKIKKSSDKNRNVSNSVLKIEDSQQIQIKKCTSIFAQNPVTFFEKTKHLEREKLDSKLSDLVDFRLPWMLSEKKFRFKILKSRSPASMSQKMERDYSLIASNSRESPITNADHDLCRLDPLKNSIFVEEKSEDSLHLDLIGKSLIRTELFRKTEKKGEFFSLAENLKHKSHIREGAKRLQLIFIRLLIFLKDLGYDFV